MTTRSPSEALTAPPAIDAAVDFVRLEEIARLAELAASYWRSIALAAGRGEAQTVRIHCSQVANVTRSAFSTVKELDGGRDAT